MIPAKLTAILLLVLASVNYCQAQTPDTIVLATYQYSSNTRLHNLAALSDYLSEHMHRSFRIKSYPTIERLVNAFGHDSVDCAMINTSGYLLLEHNFPKRADCIVNLELENKSSTNYGACIVVSSASRIKSMTDLKATTKGNFSLVMASSTSGNLYPRLLLSDGGISDPDKTFDVYYAGTHRQVAVDVSEGRASAGGCSCEEVEKHNLSSAKKLVILSSFTNIPVGPIIVNHRLDLKIVSSLKESLLNVHEAAPEAFHKFCEGWTEFKSAKNFQRVDDSHYRELLEKFDKNEKLWTLLQAK
jgi:phosphate/phosphite/phosphonate ABC transporter binding protein